MPSSQSQSETPSPSGAHVPFDVGAQQLSKVYAKALLGATEKAGVTEATLAEFGALVSDVLDRFPRFEAILSSALIDDEEKHGILDRAVGKNVSPLLLNFLKVVTQHGRLNLARTIYQAAIAGLDDLRGRIKVEIRTAAPLDAASESRIVSELHNRIGVEPRLEVREDASLIGGIVLRIGDTVYDGSVATQLGRVRQSMINRSVHEIQSRRDRFRHSGGN